MSEYPKFINVETFEYKPDLEIPNRVLQELNDFTRQYGKRPEFLILGYGTYIGLCLTISDFNHHPNIVWQDNFRGVPIVVDPGYEYRVATTWNNPAQAASMAVINKQRQNDENATERD